LNGFVFKTLVHTYQEENIGPNSEHLLLKTLILEPCKVNYISNQANILGEPEPVHLGDSHTYP